MILKDKIDHGGGKGEMEESESSEGRRRELNEACERWV